MFVAGRAAGIKALAVILVFSSFFIITSADAKREIAPGTAYIRITSQVIKRDKTGATRIVASALYNKHISPYAIGNSIGICELIQNRRTLPRGTQLCHIVFRMPLGQIIALGVKASPVYYRLAVVGGTGVYSNIGGQVQGIVTRFRPMKEKLVFTIISFKEKP